MESLQITAGFTDLKTEFIRKTNKSSDNLNFWFSFENGILFMHDYDNHKSCIVLAIFQSRNSTWKYFVRPHTYGEKLLHLVTQSEEFNNISTRLQQLYDLYGFKPFNSL